MNRLSETLSACVRKLEGLHNRHDADAGVILVQIDQMARINSSAGTATGDAVLDEIGRRLENFASDEFGPGSCVDRLDGPRFLIVPSTPMSLGALRAQEPTPGRIRRWRNFPAGDRSRRAPHRPPRCRRCC